jgi:hypothetical protein
MCGFSGLARQLAIILSAVGLSGCFATGQEVATQLNDRYVGQNVDALVSQFGPPTNSFKMNSGETSYMWQLTSQTDINVYRGAGTAQTYFCKVDVIASPAGVVTKITTEDSSNLYGESLCAKRLGLQREAS